MGLKKKKWFQTLMTIAPKVATALGGPIGGMAMNVLKEALGMPDATEAEIEKKIAQGSPETFLALKKAQQEFDAKMREFDIKEDQLVFGDIADARARQLEMKDHTPAILTGVALTFFFALSASVLYNLEIVQANKSFVMFLFGAASGWVTQGMSYFLGSSQGSARKTAILAEKE